MPDTYKNRYKHSKPADLTVINLEALRDLDNLARSKNTRKSTQKSQQQKPTNPSTKPSTKVNGLDTRSRINNSKPCGSFTNFLADQTSDLGSSVPGNSTVKPDLEKTHQSKSVAEIYETHRNLKKSIQRNQMTMNNIKTKNNHIKNQLEIRTSKFKDNSEKIEEGKLMKIAYRKAMKVNEKISVKEKKLKEEEEKLIKDDELARQMKREVQVSKKLSNQRITEAENQAERRIYSLEKELENMKIQLKNTAIPKTANTRSIKIAQVRDKWTKQYSEHVQRKLKAKDQKFEWLLKRMKKSGNDRKVWKKIMQEYVDDVIERKVVKYYGKY